MDSITDRVFNIIDTNNILGLRTLLEDGLDPNIRNHDGNNAIHLAAREGHLETCRLLIDYHSDIKDIKLYKYIDLENIYNKNLNAHFFDYIKEKFNCGDWHGEPYFKTMHPTELSHIAWGEHLYKYIRSNYEVF